MQSSAILITAEPRPAPPCAGALGDASASVLLINLHADRDVDLGGYLESQGLTVSRVGADRLELDSQLALLDVFDVAVLIGRLPGLRVLDAIRRIAGNGTIPLLVVATEGEAVERILALEMGADDLVDQQTTAREILARLHGLMRRNGPARAEAADSFPQSGVWILKPSRRTLITPSGVRVGLSARDGALLDAFTEAPDGLVVENEYPGRHLRAAIRRLRRRVLESAGVELPILNVWGEGYRFNAVLQRD